MDGLLPKASSALSTTTASFSKVYERFEVSEPLDESLETALEKIRIAAKSANAMAGKPILRATASSSATLRAFILAFQRWTVAADINQTLPPEFIESLAARVLEREVELPLHDDFTLRMETARNESSATTQIFGFYTASHEETDMDRGQSGDRCLTVQLVRKNDNDQHVIDLAAGTVTLNSSHWMCGTTTRVVQLDGLFTGSGAASDGASDTLNPWLGWWMSPRRNPLLPDCLSQRWWRHLITGKEMLSSMINPLQWLADDRAVLVRPTDRTAVPVPARDAEAVMYDDEYTVYDDEEEPVMEPPLLSSTQVALNHGFTLLLIKGDLIEVPLPGKVDFFLAGMMWREDAAAAQELPAEKYMREDLEPPPRDHPYWHEGGFWLPNGLAFIIAERASRTTGREFDGKISTAREMARHGTPKGWFTFVESTPDGKPLRRYMFDWKPCDVYSYRPGRWGSGF